MPSGEPVGKLAGVGRAAVRRPGLTAGPGRPKFAQPGGPPELHFTFQTEQGSLMKLGEVLIQHSIITQSQLDEALNAQLIYGGHLGTCLIELGYIEERALGGILSEVFGVAYAPPEAFHQIPQFAIDALSARLVEKHHAVPLKLENRVLHVAMVAPSNLAAIDELRFASGYTIVPLISAEVRIFQALERYYDLPRRLRYVRLCDKLALAAVVLDHGPGLARRETPAMSRVVPAGTDLAGPAHGGSSAAATLERSATPPIAPAAVADRLESLVDTMCRVKDEPMLGRVFLEHIAPILPRAILFRAKGGMATVWDSRGIADGPPPDCGTISITSEPVFRLVAGLTEYAGPVPAGPAHTGFFEKLGFRPPQEMVLAPAYLNDRLVALLYGDGGLSAGLPSEAVSYRRLTEKLALAIGLVDLKRRLRET